MVTVAVPRTAAMFATGAITQGILCSAFLADEFNNTPSSMVSLTVARASKQKGD